jgi:hypothetical protein
LLANSDFRRPLRDDGNHRRGLAVFSVAHHGTLPISDAIVPCVLLTAVWGLLQDNPDMIYANSTTIVQDTVDIIADSIVPHGPHPPHLPCTPIRGTNFDFCINQQDFMKVRRSSPGQCVCVS